MLSAEGREDGEEVVGGQFPSMRNAVKSRMETCKNPCRLAEYYHAFERFSDVHAVVVESAGGGFVEKLNAVVAQADAPLDVFPSIERDVLTELDVPRHCTWDADVTRVGEAMLDFCGEDFSSVL